MLRLKFSARNYSLYLVALLAMVFLFFGFAGIGFAQTDALEAVGTGSGLQNANLFEVIGNIIRIFLGTLGIIFLVLVIYAGFLWMTAGGSGEKVEKAKKILINATIGITITLFAFGITSFVIGALGGAGLVGGGSSSGSGFGIDPLSGSLGSGIVRDHYPARSQTDVARNTNIMVTFKQEMDISSFIDGYDTAGTPVDVSDDTVAEALNSNNIKIYKTEDGAEKSFGSNQVTVGFTDDLKTFVFNIPVLESPTQGTNYSVLLSDDIKTASDLQLISPGGYLWIFTTGTELDTSPPSVKSVIPKSGGTYDRNIALEINFSEAVDPTSASGKTSANFDNITVNESGGSVSGTFEISNGYRTVTFIPSEECGTNSCGETIYCLPQGSISAVGVAATPGVSPPQTDIFPYDGVVDMATNALDGNGDGEAGDDYSWTFETTGDINLSSPEIESTTPDLSSLNDVSLDQPVSITFSCDSTERSANSCNSIMMSSSLNSDNILLESNPEHILWYTARNTNEPEETPTKTVVTLPHGIFLESTGDSGGTDYAYQVAVTQGVRNQYQNCYSPAEGPGTVGKCGTTTALPFCCDGKASSTSCVGF